MSSLQPSLQKFKIWGEKINWQPFNKMYKASWCESILRERVPDSANWLVPNTHRSMNLSQTLIPVPVYSHSALCQGSRSGVKTKKLWVKHIIPFSLKISVWLKASPRTHNLQNDLKNGSHFTAKGLGTKRCTAGHVCIFSTAGGVISSKQWVKRVKESAPALGRDGKTNTAEKNKGDGWSSKVVQENWPQLFTSTWKIQHQGI